ncbi:hypothetical protein [Prosthecobacter fusiformis]|nr:hypothetical protein [Prosthecobacter fusiformis]
MKKLLYSFLGTTVCALSLSSCDTVEHDDDDDDGGPVRTHTTVTEETVRSSPYSGAVQTQTTQTVY